MAYQSSTPTAASGGLFSFWSNIKISTKIFVGFSCLLVIIAIVSFMAYRAFSNVTQMFEAYAQRVEIVGIAGDLDRGFLNLRRFVVDYANTGDEKDVASAQKQRASLREDVAKGLQASKSLERRKKIEEIGGQFETYYSGFEKAVAAKREQIKLKAEVLDPAGRKMRDDANALQAAAAKAGDSNAIVLAGALMEQVMLARLSVNKLLAQHDGHDTAAAGQATKSFNAVTQLLDTIEKAPGSSGFLTLVAELKLLEDKYRQGYQRASELTNELNKLVNTDMRNIAVDTAADAGTIKASGIAEETKLEHEALALMASSNMLIIGLAIGGLGLGAGLAFFIGNGIGTPIRQIGAVLLELAKGNKNIEVPYAHRGDEVGDNARAASTFKENLLQIERMENERKDAERAAAAQRKADMLTLADNFQAAVGEIIDTVSSASSELEASAQGLTHTAGHTQELATTVAAASEQASTNVQSVASATEELSGSVSEISRQVNESSRIANEAVIQARQTDERMTELSQAATRIGDVMKLITAIAEQTNLLALNATIEAARAGEAGKGFAVVAQEVKTLASQTAKATDEVGSQIGGIQTATQESVAAIKQIDATIHRISEIATAVASAAEEQGAATQEISRNVHQAAQGTQQVAQSISEVNRGASETGESSGQVLTAAKSMASESNRLKIEVDKFLAGVRAA